MRLSAGKLRDRFEVFKIVKTKNKYNEPLETLESIFFIRAEIITNNCDITEISGAEMALHKITIRIRFNKKIGINNVLKYKDKLFKIRGLDNVGQQNIQLIMELQNYEN